MMHWLSDGLFDFTLNVLGCFLPSEQFGLESDCEILQSVIVNGLTRQIFDSLLQYLLMLI